MGRWVHQTANLPCLKNDSMRNTWNTRIEAQAVQMQTQKCRLRFLFVHCNSRKLNSKPHQMKWKRSKKMCYIGWKRSMRDPYIKLGGESHWFSPYQSANNRAFSLKGAAICYIDWAKRILCATAFRHTGWKKRRR